MLQEFADLKKAKAFIERDPKNSIRLLFPNLDFNYSYESNAKAMNTFDEDYTH